MVGTNRSYSTELSQIHLDNNLYDRKTELHLLLHMFALWDENNHFLLILKKSTLILKMKAQIKFKKCVIFSVEQYTMSGIEMSKFAIFFYI